jgi:hypothetical protein
MKTGVITETLRGIVDRVTYHSSGTHHPHYPLCCFSIIFLSVDLILRRRYHISG